MKFLKTQWKLLKRYVAQTCLHKKVPKTEILSTNKALKHFGEMWGEHKRDTMMMITALEYEFVSEGEFTEKELVAVRGILGKMGLFFRECQAEHRLIEEAQLRRKNINK